MTRIASPSGPIGRNLDPDGRPASRGASDRQVTVDRRRAAAYRLEPEVPGMGRGGVEAAAVVGDHERDPLRELFDPDDRRMCARVLDDVGESLTADREQLLLCSRL